MSVKRLHVVQCDGCGILCRAPLQDSGVNARRDARMRGWARVPKRNATAGGSPGADYCPTCKVKR